MTVVEHRSAGELQMWFREEREAWRATRIWIVWRARLGRKEPRIAEGIGVSRREVQERVRRYSGEGAAGSEMRPQDVCRFGQRTSSGSYRSVWKPGRKAASPVRYVVSISEGS